jgi:hypothetical protein
MDNTNVSLSMNGPNSIHVFEKAGLGKAPYQFLGVTTCIGPIDLGNGHTVGGFGQPMGSCQYCSTGIAYLFWLKSADGRKFYVGSDCIFKSGDAGLRHIIEPIVLKHQKEVRENREHVLTMTFEEYLKQHPTFFADDTRPHPNSWYAKQGRTMGDYHAYCYRYAGKSKKARLARQFLMAANVPLPTARIKKEKPVKGAVPHVYEMQSEWGGIKIVY